MAKGKININIKHYFNLPYIYIFVWCIYNLQALLKLPSSASLGLLGFMAIISMYCWFKTATKYKLPAYMKAVNALALYFVCAGILRSISNDSYHLTFEQGGIRISSLAYLRTYIVSVLPIFVFYLSSKKGWYTLKDVKFMIIPFLVICILFFIQYATIMMETFGKKEAQNNTGYLFAMVIPSLAFLKSQPKKQLLLLIIAMIFVVISVKRGAIFVGILVFAYLLYDRMRSSKWSAFLIITCALVGFYYLSQNLDSLLNSDTLLARRIQDTLDGDSSNRDTLYTYFLEHIISESNIFRTIFGYGADGTVMLFGQYAHNDWLEIMIDLGAVGVIIYLAYWICFFKTAKTFKRRNEEFYLFMTLMALICLPRTIMSMSINDMSLSMTSALGVIMANAHNRRGPVRIYRRTNEFQTLSKLSPDEKISALD